MQLLQSLDYYFDEDRIDPGWHTHVEGDDSVLTIAVEPPTATVFVEMLNEGADDVWRPVVAHVVGEGEYLLPRAAPDDEVWRIPPGSLVRCEVRGDDLYALAGRPWRSGSTEL